MANVDGPALLEILWDRALRIVEGPDSGGAPLDPDAVWAKLKEGAAELGLELDVRPAGSRPTSWPAEVGELSTEDVTRATIGKPPG